VIVLQEVKTVVFRTVSAVLITLVNRNCVANHVVKVRVVSGDDDGLGCV